MQTYNTMAEEFTIRVGPLMREVLDKQKQRIKEETYDVCNSSDYEAGEIIAKKVVKERLV